ncbi:MAG: hypothetical protein ACPG5U_05875 [Planktomarina sp.]
MFEHFTLTAFESPWFWILLFVQWGVILFRPMGVPYDVIISPTKTDDLIALTRIQAVRHKRAWPFWVLPMIGFVISLLLVVGIGYRIEFAVAGLIILLPQLIVAALNLRTAHRLDFETIEGIRKPLQRLQTWSQMLGFGVICIASFIGSVWLAALGG